MTLRGFLPADVAFDCIRYAYDEIQSSVTDEKHIGGGLQNHMRLGDHLKISLQIVLFLFSKINLNL